MASRGSESLERLRGLQHDLASLSESRLPNIERLWLELDSRVDEFRNLLDKKPKNDASRQSLSSGTFRTHWIIEQISAYSILTLRVQELSQLGTHNIK